MQVQDLTHETVAQLLAAEAIEPKVTVYIPMHISGSPPHLTGNQIRFKNLVHSAAEALRAKGHTSLARMLDDEVADRMSDVAFWEAQTEGLLICAEPGTIAAFHLPIDTEEYVAVDSCYHLAPVLALLGDEQSFYVLAIAQHKPKLFAGSMYGLCEIEAGLPDSLESSLNIDEHNQRGEQSQSLGNGVGFNGRGGVRDPRQEERLRFFRLIDNIVYNAIERSLPLVLAGTETEVAEFHHLSKYPHVTKQAVIGSFSAARAHDLFEAAYGIIYQEHVVTRRQQALSTYQRLLGVRQERIATDPLAIAEAAKQGRVDTLLVTLTRNTADTVRDTAQAVERLTFPAAELSALINKAASAVAQASGRIVNLDIGAAGSSTPVMAVLRY